MEDADEKAKISSADLGTFQSRLGFHLPAVSCMYSDQAVYSRVCSCLLTIPNQTQQRSAFLKGTVSRDFRGLQMILID